MKNVKITMLLMMAAFLYSAANSIASPHDGRAVVVRTPPRGARVSIHAGVSFRYYNGVYYRPYGTRFIVTRPPVGIRISILPPGYTTVVWSGIPYFYYGGVYYVQRQPQVYEVIEAPREVVQLVPNHPASTASIGSLPPGTETVEISGKRYYRINDTYYEKTVSENGQESYIQVGKKN
ncbi:DUF6515 family protein [Arcticibacter tournemirensis]